VRIARRVWLVVLLAYLGLDFGCPLVPGAFQFDPSQSVDAATAYRVAGGTAFRARLPVEPRAGADAHLPVWSTRSPLTGGRHVGELAVPAPVAWRPHAGRDHGLAPDPHAPAGDG
jgi:hypothetical protein